MKIQGKIDLYNGDQRKIGALRRLENSKIPKGEKEVIVKFINCISAREKLCPGREAKLMDELRKVRLGFKKNYKSLRKSDIEKFILKLNKSNYSHATQEDYRQHFKRFFKWYWIDLGKFNDFGNTTFYPKEVSWIRNPRKETERNGFVRGVLLEEKEVLEIINSCNQPMWKALLWILWEGGLRPGELLNLRNKSIEPTDFGIRLNIEFGKTGARKLPLIQAKQSVLIWLKCHPKKNNPDELLFPISYSGVRIKVERLSRKIGIKGKETGMKWWRKARATYLAKIMTSAQLKYWFGWSDIKTSEAYVRVSEKDILPTVMDMNNIEHVEKGGSIVKFLKCSKCNERNDENNLLCIRCGNPLTSAGLMKLEEEKRALVREEFQKMFKKVITMPIDERKKIFGVLNNPNEEIDRQFGKIIGL